MNKSYTVGQLKADMKALEHMEDDEPLVVVLDDDLPEDAIQGLEEGSVLDITEFGGYIQGMRTLRVRPR